MSLQGAVPQGGGRVARRHAQVLMTMHHGRALRSAVPELCSSANHLADSSCSAQGAAVSPSCLGTANACNVDSRWRRLSEPEGMP